MPCLDSVVWFLFHGRNSEARWNIQNSSPLVEPVCNRLGRHKQIRDTLPPIDKILLVPQGNAPAVGAGFYRHVGKLIYELLNSSIEVELFEGSAPKEFAV